jgi:hypothetical protein
MGTRSKVGVMIGDKCRAVYVHWDGYLSGVGADLQEYTQQKDVESLIANGDRSSLTDGFYKDRGETGVAPRTYDTFDEFFDSVEGCWGEYYYVFKDGVWYCGNTYGGHPLYKKLTAYADAVAMQAKEEEYEL